MALVGCSSRCSLNPAAQGRPLATACVQAASGRAIVGRGRWTTAAGAAGPGSSPSSHHSHNSDETAAVEVGSGEAAAAGPRFDKCELVNAFCEAAVAQQGRPREHVHSYSEPAGQHSGGGRPGGQLVFPAWGEAMASHDSHEVIDWSDLENDGWGSSSSSSGGGGSSGGGAGGRGPGAPSATAVAGQSSRVSAALSSVAWGGSVVRHHHHSGRGLLPRASAARSTRCRASAPSSSSSPSGDAAQQQQQQHQYDGADSEALFPDGSLETDDPGHPAELAAAAALAAAARDQQGAVLRPEQRPYMNIVNGRWQPPSKAEAEATMSGLNNMGTDEGV